jgi:glycosyltransferase involved in cell wall biosynthesis
MAQMRKSERKPVSVVFCTPSYSGNSGDALNERQLIESLSQRVAAIYVLNLLDVTLLHPAYRKTLCLKPTRSNIKLINIPVVPVVPERFVALYTIRLLAYDILLLFLVALLKKLRLVDCIYIRNPENAFAFSAFKKLVGPFALKFAGFHTQEALAPIRGRFQKWLFINIFERINYRALNSADLILIQSSFYEQELRERYSLDKTKPMLVTPAGIDLEKLRKVREKCLTSLKKERDHNAEFRIGVVGSVTWWDGLDILLESMPGILKSHPKVVLNFVFGIGDTPLLNNLKLRASALGLNVSFKGPLTHEKALAEMCQLSALVLPRRRTQSTEITIPIKVKEALALGVPVIVTRHKVFENMFRDFEDVIYVEPEAEDVAEKVVMLLSNPALAEHLSAKGPQMATRFSYDRISQDFADALFTMKRVNPKELEPVSISG